MPAQTAPCKGTALSDTQGLDHRLGIADDYLCLPQQRRLRIARRQSTRDGLCTIVAGRIRRWACRAILFKPLPGRRWRFTCAMVLRWSASAILEMTQPLTLIWIICLLAVAVGVITFALGFWARRPKIQVESR